MLVQVMSPMPQKNRSNSGSSNTMISPKKLRRTASESGQRGPLIRPTARKAESARPRRVRLCLETNTYSQISGSRGNAGRSRGCFYHDCACTGRFHKRADLDPRRIQITRRPVGFQAVGCCPTLVCPLGRNRGDLELYATCIREGRLSAAHCRDHPKNHVDRHLLRPASLWG